MIGAKPVREGPGRGAGDPFALAFRGGDAAVQGGRRFEGDKRPPLGDAHQIAGVEGAGFVIANANGNFYSGVLEALDAGARDPGVGVFEGDDGGADTGFDEGFGAGSGLALVIAGFQRHVGGGAFGQAAGPGQGLGFGVRPAAGLGPSAADDAVAQILARQNATHRRVGPDVPQPPARQRQRRQHDRGVSAGRRGVVGMVSRLAHCPVYR